MIYLASPYTHPDRAIEIDRYQQVCAAAAMLMKRGEVVFSPIAHGHAIASQNDLPTDWEFWKKQCIGILGSCDHLYVLKLEGWSLSKGVHAEISYAMNEICLPITYLEWPL